MGLCLLLFSLSSAHFILTAIEVGAITLTSQVGKLRHGAFTQVGVAEPEPEAWKLALGSEQKREQERALGRGEGRAWPTARAGPQGPAILLKEGLAGTARGHFVTKFYFFPGGFSFPCQLVTYPHPHPHPFPNFPLLEDSAPAPVPASSTPHFHTSGLLCVSSAVGEVDTVAGGGWPRGRLFKNQNSFQDKAKSSVLWVGRGFPGADACLGLNVMGGGAPPDNLPTLHLPSSDENIPTTKASCNPQLYRRKPSVPPH